MEIKSLIDPEAGLVNRRIFADREIYELERERLFSRCWLYLGHESEVPNPGDFVTVYMGEEPMILCRDLDGRLRAFLNLCRHRGNRVCRADRGNTKLFTCSYHGWTYSSDGTLAIVPILVSPRCLTDQGGVNFLKRHTQHSMTWRFRRLNALPVRAHSAQRNGRAA
jgi:phenylpropionate dioxygenase-like ring-hydroxylating dioxygenase large terminal subunit